MELIDFLKKIQAAVRERMVEILQTPDSALPIPEMVFAEIVMSHMQDAGMTFEPQLCHYETAVESGGKLRLSGYALSEELDQLDLFVTLYSDVDNVETVPAAEVVEAAEQCLRFLSWAAEKKLASKVDETSEAYLLAVTIEEAYQTLERIFIYVLTDKVAKAQQLQDRCIQGKIIGLEIIDIERLHRQLPERKLWNEVIVNFEDLSGVIPCVWVPGEMSEYDYAMTVIPGEDISLIYEKYGSRILQASPRSFVGQDGRVNKDILGTLRSEPERFMAYNTGLVIVADEVHLGRTAGGDLGITCMKGMQIVNGGQTSASLYLAERNNADVDLTWVSVPAKVIVLRPSDAVDQDKLIADISLYANSQNKVQQSDFAANHPLHIALENHAARTYCPDGSGRWFYERSAGSYRVMLEREGNTIARKRALKNAIPPARKLTKPDMAKYLNIWHRKPDIVSLGAQKNFIKFMESQPSCRWESGEELPTLQDYKLLVAKAIIFLAAQKIIRRRYNAFQANIATYTLSLMVMQFGERLNLDMVWQNQAISPALGGQISEWSQTVHDELHRSAMTRMVSEWAKKPECWEHMRSVKFDEPSWNIPEIR